METKFQTSFIPKKPLGGPSPMIPRNNIGPRKSISHSLLFNIAILLFIVSIGGAGGTYAWKSVLLSNQEDLKIELDNREKQFNRNLIQELKTVNVKIDTAKQLLNNHTAVSNVFDIIAKLTIRSVRFTSLDMTVRDAKSNDVKIALNGYGTNLSAVAFQSKVLGQLEQYGLRQIVKNPVISNPALDTEGSVSFGFSATLDPATLSYTNSFSGSNATSTP